MDNRPDSQSETFSAVAEDRRPKRWIGSIGPGFVYALSVLGTGDIVSNSAAGASYGYSLMWALAMALVFRYVWVSTTAKYVLVTGESLLSGYGRVSRWVPLLVLLSFLPIRHFTNQFVILIMGSSAHMLFPLPTAWSSVIWACLFTFLGFAITFWGSYAMIELFCKVLVGIMGGSLLIAALLSNPDPIGILGGIFLPSLPQAQGLYSAGLIVMALIGAEAGSTGSLIYAYFIREKGWKDVSFLKQQRFDLATGVIALFVMGGLLQIAAAGTIHPLGIQVEDPEDLGRIFWETQGVVGLVAFSLGLWGAAFSTFIGLNIGFAFVFTDICRNFVPGLKDSGVQKREGYTPNKDPLYRWILVFWSFAPIYIVFTDVKPVWLVLMVMAFIVLLIPVLAVCLLWITNDESLMGRYRNGWLTNLVLVTLVLIALYLTYERGLDLWNDLGGLR
ncbi:MAG: Nramp family divalent metal transporter [Acidobacteriota bacterium]